MSNTTKSTDASIGFKKRLVMSVILLNLFVYSLAGISLYQSRDNHEKRASVSTQNIASVLEHDIDGTMDNINITLLAVKNEAEGQLARGGINKESLNRYIIRQHSYLPSISALRMTDAKGDLVYGTGLTSAVAINIADRDYFKFGLNNPKGNLFISKPILGRVTNKWLINVARRVNKPDGSFAGIVFGSLTFNHLSKLFASIDVGKKGSITLRDEELALIIRHPEIANSIGNKSVSKEFSDLYTAGAKNATFKGVAGIDGAERLISYRKMPEYPIVVVVALAQDEYLANWRKETMTQLSLAAFFTLFTIFSSRMLVARWIREKEHEVELRKANDELELRIVERTADLNQANDQLKVELSERKQAEEAQQESERKYRLLFETAGDSISVIDLHGNVLSVNPQGCEMLGYTYEELLAIRLDSIDTKPERLPELIGKVFQSGFNTFDTEHFRKDGSTIPVSSDSRLINWDGQPAILNICRDITVRKLNEEALRESEAKHRTIIQTALDGFWLVDEQGRLLEVNEAYARMSGYSVPELLTMSIQDLDADETASDTATRIQRIITQGEARFETRHRRKDGSYFYIEASVQYRSAEGGQFVAFQRDITERKLTEEKLRATELRYHTLFDSMTDGFASVDLEGRIVEFNKAFCTMIGYTVEEARNLTYEQITPREWHAAERKIVEDQVMVRGFSDIYEKEYRRKDGSTLPVELRAYLFRDSEDIPAGMWAIVRDVSERKKTEKMLQEAREFLETAVAQSPSGILIADAPDVKIRMANPAAFNIRGGNRRTLTGIEVAKHSEKWQTFRPDGSPYPSEQLPLSRAVLHGEVVHDEEAIIRDEEGNDHWVSANAAPIRNAEGQVTAGIVVFHDITDRKHAEENRINMEKQLLHAQKLESLGVLAGGIAHDFNNILMAIMGNADLALMRINKESPVIDNLHRIEQAAARAADLAKQMLAYSGKGKFVVESLDLTILLEEMLHMLEVSISKKAVLRLNPTQHLPSVEADATQMRQIIMNLVINASEAIGDKSGVIAISTGCLACDRSYLKDVWLDENLSDGLYVYLEIADSGCGMDKTTMAKLFDPFFSTKFAGRGLGMAAVLGIVRGHKGSIKVYSELGKGTTFKILLPASSKPAEIFNGESHHDDWKGKGKVLLVDDEETVRGIGTEMLKELGFTPITANDGLEALEAYKSNPDIVLVLLDLTMPHMDGEQCFRELRQIKPDVKVVISSGFSEYEVTQKFAGKGLAGFIQKPYKLSVLRDALKKF